MAIQELVVPRSMPMTLAIFKSLFLGGLSGAAPLRHPRPLHLSKQGNNPVSNGLGVYRVGFLALQADQRDSLHQNCNFVWLACAIADAIIDLARICRWLFNNYRPALQLMDAFLRV